MVLIPTVCGVHPHCNAKTPQTHTDCNHENFQLIWGILQNLKNKAVVYGLF